MKYITRNLRGDKLKGYKEGLPSFSQEQRDIIVGTLLGDACIPRAKDRSSFSIYWGQKLEAYSYVNSIYEKFHSFIGMPPRIRKTFIPGTGNTYYSLRCQTYGLKVILPFAQSFYYVDSKDRWIKRLPHEIEDLLTPRALAY